MNIIEPKSSEEFRKYYNLRYEILRKPWGQPKGSEKDELESSSQHVIVMDSQKRTVGVGRFQFNSITQAQIRYMAVHPDYQGMGVGKQIIGSLEEIAKTAHAKLIILQSRENAIPFYKNCGYEVVERSYLLFDTIQHYLMQKKLENNC